ncbi:Crp/Fnr family transcriptional regulator [Sulfurovum sp.]|uniref:Crp/Fnr family transcriptional regulator n=1 Tax=Sulfurovum sp. TaxID=1969726 RepID=UPI003561C5EC
MHLTAYPFIKKLEPEALTFLENHIQPVSIPKNTLLFYQGEICDNILWLTSGKVRLYTQSDTIEEITLYTLKAGEQCIVNTASLLSNTNAVASAETLTDIKGYLINAHSVKALSKMSDVYQNYLFSLYQLRFEELTALINDIRFKRLDTRIIEWLEKQPDHLIEITHAQLATELGSSRVVISRLLKDLEQKGTVLLHRGKIEVL